MLVIKIACGQSLSSSLWVLEATHRTVHPCSASSYQTQIFTESQFFLPSTKLFDYRNFVYLQYRWTRHSAQFRLLWCSSLPGEQVETEGCLDNLIARISEPFRVKKKGRVPPSMLHVTINIRISIETKLITLASFVIFTPFLQQSLIRAGCGLYLDSLWQACRLVTLLLSCGLFHSGLIYSKLPTVALIT